MSLDEYLVEVLATKLENPRWRDGQTYFNVLYRVRPDLAERVEDGGLDPFHRDSVIPAFLAFVSTNWKED